MESPSSGTEKGSASGWRRLDWRVALGFGVTFLLLWWVVRGVDFSAVVREIRGADYLLLAVAVAVATAGFLIRALRWKVLLQPVRSDTGLGSRFAAVNIGFMANNVLPLRVGEFARAYALSRMERVSAGGAFGSLAVERFLDAFTILVLLLVSVAAPDFPEGATLGGRSVGSVVNGMVGFVGVVLAGLVVLLLWPRKLVRLAERVLARFLPAESGRRAVDSLEAFLAGLTSMREPKLMTAAVAWSLLFWTWNCLGFWIGFRAFGIDASFFAAMFVNSIVAFAVAAPSSPGFFGTFHAGVKVALLGVYGVGEGETLAFAFGYHLGGFIPVTIIGLYYAWRLGLSLGEIERSEIRVEEEVERDHPETAPLLRNPTEGE